jgi:glycerophosphoryl diester phosphodiesterase
MTTLPILVPPAFRIIAHRGASAYVPENTLAAFQLALDMGVTEVETDVRLTRDGVAVLCHDDTLARYGYGPLSVEALMWTELSQLDMGSWFSPHLHRDQRILTLDALFAHFGDKLTYHLELKGKTPGLAAATQALITKHGLRANVFITSFMYESLVDMKAVDPTMRLGWLVADISDETMEKAKALGLYQLCPRANRVTVETVDRARAVVTEVRAWGLNGEQTARQAADVQALIHQVLAAGCDGMTINWPDWVCHG